MNFTHTYAHFLDACGRHQWVEAWVIADLIADRQDRLRARQQWWVLRERHNKGEDVAKETLRGEMRALRERAQQMDPEVIRDAYALRDRVCEQIKAQTGDMAHDALLLVELGELIEGVGKVREIHERMADREWFHDIREKGRVDLTQLVAKRVAEAMLEDAEAERGVFETIKHYSHMINFAHSMGVFDAIEVVKEYVIKATPLMIVELTEFEAGYVYTSAEEAAEILDTVIEGIFGDGDPLLRALANIRDGSEVNTLTDPFEACVYLAARAWDYSEEYIDDTVWPDDDDDDGDDA